MKNSKILVLTTSEGHRSIGEAVTSYLKKHGYEPDFCFIEEDGLKYYKLFYQRAPHLFKTVYELSKTRFVDFFLQALLKHEHFHQLKYQIERYKPQVIINTSFGFTSSLLALKKTHPFTFINIIPNPRTYFDQDVAVGAEALCAFDEHIISDLKKHQTHPVILKTGWFVRKEFEPEYNLAKIKTELGLNTELYTLLIVAGSEGTETIFHIAQSLSEFSSLQCIVACGNNLQLLQEVQQLGTESKARVIGLPFTTQIYKYMQAANMLVGKAGPNMIFEAIATETPFFATTHVAGLEDGNIEIIKEYDIGFVEEDPEKAVALLKNLIANPELIAQKLPQVKKLAQYNNTQRQTLLEFLEKI